MHEIYSKRIMFFIFLFLDSRVENLTKYALEVLSARKFKTTWSSLLTIECSYVAKDPLDLVKNMKDHDQIND